MDYSLTTHQTIDDSLVEATEYAQAGEPIRVRVQPQLYIKRPGAPRLNSGTARRALGTYLAWRGLYWNMTCDTVQEGTQLRLVMARFFGLLDTHGLARVKKVLDTLNQEPVESAAELVTHTHTAST